jgi:hypothetical protein
MIGAVFLADAHPGSRRIRARHRGEPSGSGPGTEFPPGQGGTPWEQGEHRHVPQGGHPHGKPTSWVLVGVVIAAFTTGGVAIIAHAWWLLWTCASLIVLAIPAGKVVGIMNDTVSGAAHQHRLRRWAALRDRVRAGERQQELGGPAAAAGSGGDHTGAISSTSGVICAADSAATPAIRQPSPSGSCTSSASCTSAAWACARSPGNWAQTANSPPRSPGCHLRRRVPH